MRLMYIEKDFLFSNLILYLHRHPSKDSSDTPSFPKSGFAAQFCWKTFDTNFVDHVLKSSNSKRSKIYITRISEEHCICSLQPGTKQIGRLSGDGGSTKFFRRVFSRRIGLYFTLNLRFYGSRESPNVLDELLGLGLRWGRGQT